ncbi:MAG: YfcE family phosphodiesterase [Campylobacterota bacterium]|nr:YfcE family phosphodiesterase [Campylobacterota bacterium]
MKIGIFSDTHTKTKLAKQAIEHLLDEGAEFIIHAGDICERKVLDELSECGKRYVAVYGNNDSKLTSYHNQYSLVQEPHYFKLANTRFKLMHLPFYMAPDTDVVIFGHTHQFECDFRGGTLFLNPGETCGRNRGTSEFAMLEVVPAFFRITYYTRDPEASKIHAQHFTFERAHS